MHFIYTIRVLRVHQRKVIGDREIPGRRDAVRVYCTPLLTARMAEAPVGTLAVAVSVAAWPEVR